MRKTFPKHCYTHSLTYSDSGCPQRGLVCKLAGEFRILHSGLGRRVPDAAKSRRAEASHSQARSTSPLGLGQRAPVAGRHARAAGRVPVIPVPVRVVVVPVLALARHAHARHPGVHQPGAQHTASGSARATTNPTKLLQANPAVVLTVLLSLKHLICWPPSMAQTGLQKTQDVLAQSVAGFECLGAQMRVQEMMRVITRARR